MAQAKRKIVESDSYWKSQIEAIESYVSDAETAFMLGGPVEYDNCVIAVQQAKKDLFYIANNMNAKEDYKEFMDNKVLLKSVVDKVMKVGQYLSITNKYDSFDRKMLSIVSLTLKKYDIEPISHVQTSMDNASSKKTAAPSRVGKKGILIYVEPETADAFNALKDESGATTEYLGNKAIALLLESEGKAVPRATENRIADTRPKRPGPQPGHGGRPRKVQAG